MTHDASAAWINSAAGYAATAVVRAGLVSGCAVDEVDVRSESASGTEVSPSRSGPDHPLELWNFVIVAMLSAWSCPSPVRWLEHESRRTESIIWHWIDSTIGAPIDYIGIESGPRASAAPTSYSCSL